MRSAKSYVGKFESMTGLVCYAEIMGEAEKRFHQLLGFLALQCSAPSRPVELDEFMIGLYDKHLSKHGYEAVNTALEAILVERGPNDTFPPVGSILARMGATVTPKSLVTDVTNRISVAVRTKGYNWIDKVSDFEADQLRVLGEAGVAVVKRLGGWTVVCEMANENPKFYQNWIRDTASAVIESTGSKYLRIVPEAPQVEGTRPKQLSSDG